VGGGCGKTGGDEVSSFVSTCFSVNLLDKYFMGSCLDFMGGKE
jgi:hypothetical protein